MEFLGVGKNTDLELGLSFPLSVILLGLNLFLAGLERGHSSKKGESSRGENVLKGDIASTASIRIPSPAPSELLRQGKAKKRIERMGTRTNWMVEEDV